MTFLPGSLNVIDGLTMSFPVFANPFKDYFIENVCSLLHFLSLLGLQVLSSRRMPSVPFLSQCRLPLPCPSLSLSLTCIFTVHPLCFKIILYFKWVSSLQIPPPFLALISPLFSTGSSVKPLFVHLIWRVSSTVERIWY